MCGRLCCSPQFWEGISPKRKSVEKSSRSEGQVLVEIPHMMVLCKGGENGRLGSGLLSARAGGAGTCGHERLRLGAPRRTPAARTGASAIWCCSCGAPSPRSCTAGGGGVGTGTVTW